MDRAQQTIDLVAGLLKRCGHPDLAAVDISFSGPPALKVAHPDGSRNFLTVPHVGRADEPAPERPSWPGYPPPPPNRGGAW
jgi:hypothetical protein